MEIKLFLRLQMSDVPFPRTVARPEWCCKCNLPRTVASVLDCDKRRRRVGCHSRCSAGLAGWLRWRWEGVFSGSRWEQGPTRIRSDGYVFSRCLVLFSTQLCFKQIAGLKVSIFSYCITKAGLVVKLVILRPIPRLIGRRGTYLLGEQNQKLVIAGTNHEIDNLQVVVTLEQRIDYSHSQNTFTPKITLAFPVTEMFCLS